MNHEINDRQIADHISNIEDVKSKVYQSIMLINDASINLIGIFNGIIKAISMIDQAIANGESPEKVLLAVKVELESHSLEFSRIMQFDDLVRQVLVKSQVSCDKAKEEYLTSLGVETTSFSEEKNKIHKSDVSQSELKTGEIELF